MLVEQNNILLLFLKVFFLLGCLLKGSLQGEFYVKSRLNRKTFFFN